MDDHEGPVRYVIDDAPEFVLSARRCADGHGTLAPLFFSEDFVDVARAKAICARCSSRRECLDGALERAEPWGVWGGELLEDGRVRAHKRPHGRPARAGRPIVVIPEVPLPAHAAS
jgi:WhiB family redox-sensing transcriptional regulator